MSYTKTTWNNNAAPAINATNLNNMEQGISDAHEWLGGLFDVISYQYNTTATIEAHSYLTAAEYTLSPKDGYTPIGIIGFRSNVFRLRPTSNYITEDGTLYFGLSNASTTDCASGNTVTFYILCVKEDS